MELRQITTDDVDFMVRLVNNRGVTRYIPGMITDAKLMKAWIEELTSSDQEFIATKS